MLLVKRIADNLKHQVSLHQGLLETLDAENQLTAACSLKELQSIHKKRDSLVDQLKEEEKKRTALVEMYAFQEGLETKPTLQSIIQNCDHLIGLDLSKSRKILKKLLEKIQETGRINARKASSRLRSIKDVQSNIHKSFMRIPVYSGKGVVSQPQGSCLLQKSV